MIDVMIEAAIVIMEEEGEATGIVATTGTALTTETARGVDAIRTTDVVEGMIGVMGIVMIIVGEAATTATAPSDVSTAAKKAISVENALVAVLSVSIATELVISRRNARNPTLGRAEKAARAKAEAKARAKAETDSVLAPVQTPAAPPEDLRL